MTDNNCALLSLPAELRFHIYSYLFDAAVIQVEQHTPPANSTSSDANVLLTGWNFHNLDILSTCKTIYSEAMAAHSASLVFIAPKLNLSHWALESTIAPLPAILDSYLHHIRHFRIEVSHYQAHDLRFRLDRFTGLKSLTYYENSNSSRKLREQVGSDIDAMAWLNGEHDHELVRQCIKTESKHCRLGLYWHTVCRHWYHEQLSDPGRSYQLLKESKLEIRLLCPGVGAICRVVNLRYNPDSCELVDTAQGGYSLYGSWESAIRELCAARNREAGFRDARIERSIDLKDWEFPV